MFKSKGEAGEVRGRKFRVVDNGLDEAEVAALVSSLIDQNSDLLNKQDNLRYLTKLLEKAVLKAQEEASSIREEAEREANARATAIIAEAEEDAKEKISRAEQQAGDIIKEAKKEVETLKELARKEATDIVSEARQRSEAAERQAQELLIEAAEKVESIRGLAEEEASRLIADVKQRAERSADAKIIKAEEEGQKIIEEAMKTAETETLHIRQQAEQILLVSKRLGEDEVRDNFEKFFEGLLPGQPGEGERAAVSSGRGRVDGKQNFALYDGAVELTIPPPVALDGIVRLHRHLRGTPDIKIVKVRGTEDKGLKIQLHLRSRTPLLKILEEFPEVEKVTDPLQRAGSTAQNQAASGKRPIRRIVVTTRK